MILDGIDVPHGQFTDAFHRALMYAAKLGTFHVSEIADHFFVKGGVPSQRGAVEAAVLLIRSGQKAGWVKEVSRRDGFYRTEGIEHPPIKLRARV